MSRLKQVGLLLANLVFYAFLAAYWYLATNLPPWHALVGALLSYGLFLALRDRLRIPGPSPLIVALAGVLFFFMFSPLPSLRGLSQMFALMASSRDAVAQPPTRRPLVESADLSHGLARDSRAM